MRSKFNKGLCEAIGSVEAVRCHQRKCGYHHPELPAVQHTFHQVSTGHFTHISAQIASRHIVVNIAGFQHRLQSHDPCALHFPHRSISIINKPMPAQQLYGMFAMVFDQDLISEHKVILAWIGVIWLIFRQHGDFDAICNFGNHVDRGCCKSIATVGGGDNESAAPHF